VRVLLLHPPIGRDLPPNQRTDNLSICYIAAVLKRDGHEVEVLDSAVMGLGPRETINAVLARNFDCLGITSTHEQKDFFVKLVRSVRARRKDALLIAGGYLATLSAYKLLTICPEVDLLIRGEGEAVTSEVFSKLAHGEDCRSTPGIAYIKDGKPVINPMPPLIADLDTIPFPDRTSLVAGPKEMQVSIAASRGCYHRCSFCCINSFYELSGGHAPRFRSPASFVDEIESIVETTGRKDFMIIDDDFIGPGPKMRARAAQIGDEIRSRKLGITFSIECRADEIDEDLLKLLKEAGLTGVFLGIESGVQRQLDIFNKQLTVEQNVRALEMARSTGINVKAGLILLDPYTTITEVEEAQRFIRENQLSSLSLESRVKLYPGVPLAEKVRADGLLIERDGIDLDYRFKDPTVGLMHRVTKTSAAVSDSVKAMKSRFGLGGKR